MNQNINPNLDPLKIRCPICGNDDLAFVNVPHSKKAKGILLRIAKFISLAALIIIGIFIISLVSVMLESDSILKNIEALTAIFAMVAFLSDLIVITLIISGFIKLIPYKNDNEIQYVCKHCGHHDSVDKISRTH